MVPRFCFPFVDIMSLSSFWSLGLSVALRIIAEGYIGQHRPDCEAINSSGRRFSGSTSLLRQQRWVIKAILLELYINEAIPLKRCARGIRLDVSMSQRYVEQRGPAGTGW